MILSHHYSILSCTDCFDTRILELQSESVQGILDALNLFRILQLILRSNLIQHLHDNQTLLPVYPIALRLPLFQTPRTLICLPVHSSSHNIMAHISGLQVLVGFCWNDPISFWLECWSEHLNLAETALDTDWGASCFFTIRVIRHTEMRCGDTLGV